MGSVGGTLPGFSPLMRAAARTPEWNQVIQQGLPGKDWNDQPVATLAGASDGSAIYSSWDPTF
jgi:hypothetical protein